MKSPATTAPAALPVPGPQAALDLAAPSPTGAGTGACGAGAAGPSGAACSVGSGPGSDPGSGSGAVPRPRADAVRNRERILTAAREALVEFGSTAPLDEIARRAGVGNATLYRHFPDRPTLVHHVVLFVMDRVTLLAETVLAETVLAETVAADGPDAFDALCRFTHGAADERIGALCPMLSGDFDRDHPELLASRTALEEAVEALVAAGQSCGLLRTDIGVGDLLIALSQLSRPLPGTACFDVDLFAHRHLQLFLDGLRAPAPSRLPGAPTTLADLRRKTM
ncbi:TetR/AcrR family transcriptional regulator [Streptomyces sp. ISL-66]|uniref:TetR/AcrR family transcriptional regulator n=1 Tax=Streptomyces sp. ISL-66 TaxID=2819186 RepID=UPI001BEC6578|nr:TetR/AcrR family transcriptional regulator [Streptomyces sp. ISL-66]MBT2467059.1 TetR/AcrR family transcriptional regulator [Streptomyces sp. ISL-66]